MDIWIWRNCRSIGLRVELWLWPWAFGTFREEDVYGGIRGFQFGPLTVALNYSIGNASAEGISRWFALSEREAERRLEQALTSTEQAK